MPRTSKFVGITILFLLITQIVLLFLEGSFLWNPTIEQGENIVMVERIIAPGAEELILGQYVVNRFYKSEGYGVDGIDTDDLTLALHGSVDRLYQLIEFGEVWDGPISFSAYAPGLDASFLDDAIDGLRMCWRKLRKNVIFHVVYPQSRPANMSQVGSMVYLSCKDVTNRLRRRKPIDIRSHLLTYPHNVMRNAARSSVITHWVLHLDTEVIPTSTLRQNFLDFMEKNKRKPNYTRTESSLDTYILPVFEIRHNIPSLSNKSQLLKVLENQDARPLFQETCLQCQAGTNYEKWLELSEEKELNVSYTVPYSPWWEPFFIASRTSPIYDERITPYGFDRLFHMCFLQAQNYRFHVLNNQFLLHRGFRWKNKMSVAEKWKIEHKNNFQQKFLDIAKRFEYSDNILKQCFEID